MGYFTIRGMNPRPTKSRLAEALEHIQRNGSLLWMGCSGYEADQLFGEMQRCGYIERRPWSQNWHLTASGANAAS